MTKEILLKKWKDASDACEKATEDLLALRWYKLIFMPWRIVGN